IFHAGIRPAADRLEKWGISRWAAVGLIYLAIVIFLLSFTVIVANEFVEQLQNLLISTPQITQNVTDLIKNIAPGLGDIIPLQQIADEINNYAVSANTDSSLRALLTQQNLL